MPPYTYNIDAEAMTRSDVASAKRNLEGLKESVEQIQKKLINSPVDQANVMVVAEQLLHAAKLRQTIQETEASILSSLPQQKGGKLSEQERKEIAGFYSTGLYTQTALASHYGVVQSTIQTIVAGPNDTTDTPEDDK